MKYMYSTLQWYIDADTKMLLFHTQDYNSYVDQLHQKLSEGPDPEPMELADKVNSTWHCLCVHV